MLLPQNVQLFILDLLGALGLTIVLRYFYIHFGTANTNRRSLGDNFPLLSACVCLVIFLIQGSLALSLGLVGALSIVRFRAAIKEPEELVYLFFAIAIGLGFGARQGAATSIAFFILLAVLYLRYRFIKDKGIKDKLILHLSCSPSKSRSSKDFLSKILTSLEKHCTEIHIRRIDDNAKGDLSYIFGIDIKDLAALNALRKDLLKLSPSLEISIVDNSSPIL